jgi:hypothetical protein
MEAADCNVLTCEERHEIINTIGIAFFRSNAFKAGNFLWAPHDRCDPMPSLCELDKDSRSGVPGRTYQSNPHPPLSRQ